MAAVRMIFVEADAEAVAAVADVVRMALGVRPASALPDTAVVETPAAVPSIAAPAPARVQRRRKAAPAAKKSAATPPQSPPASRVTTGESIPTRVLEIIRKGPPRTSGEIYDLLRKQGFTGAISPVYSACAAHKAKGLVVTKPDDSVEGGGTMKYHMA